MLCQKWRCSGQQLRSGYAGQIFVPSFNSIQMQCPWKTFIPNHRGTALRFATRTREFCLSNPRSFSYSKRARVWGYTSSLPCVVMELCLIKHRDNYNFQCLHFSVVKHWKAMRYSKECLSQWPRRLQRRSAAARLLRLWVRIPPGAWMFVVSVMCCQVEVSATCWSRVQTSPTDCGASLCVILKRREWGSPGPLGAVAPKPKYSIESTVQIQGKKVFHKLVIYVPPYVRLEQVSSCQVFNFWTSLGGQFSEKYRRYINTLFAFTRISFFVFYSYISLPPFYFLL